MRTCPLRAWSAHTRSMILRCRSYSAPAQRPTEPSAIQSQGRTRAEQNRIHASPITAAPSACEVGAYIWCSPTLTQECQARAQSVSSGCASLCDITESARTKLPEWCSTSVESQGASLTDAHWVPAETCWVRTRCPNLVRCTQLGGPLLSDSLRCPERSSARAGPSHEHQVCAEVEPNILRPHASPRVTLASWATSLTQVRLMHLRHKQHHAVPRALSPLGRQICPLSSLCVGVSVLLFSVNKHSR